MKADLTAACSRAGLSLDTRLKIARCRLGLSQQQVALHVGVSRAAIGQWENRRASPTFDHLHEVAAILDVPMSWLIGDGPDEIPSARAPENGEFTTLGDAMNAALATAAGTWASDPNISDAERARREILTLRWQIEQLQARIVERERVVLAYEEEINDHRARAWVEGIEPVRAVANG